MDSIVAGSIIATLGTIIAALIAALVRLSRSSDEKKRGAWKPPRDDLRPRISSRLVPWYRIRHRDSGDILAELQSWLGHRDGSLNTRVMRYSDVDRRLGLPRGSAKKYLARAAERSYVVGTKGENSILLKRRPPEVRRSKWIDGALP